MIKASRVWTHTFTLHSVIHPLYPRKAWRTPDHTTSTNWRESAWMSLPEASGRGKPSPVPQPTCPWISRYMSVVEPDLGNLVLRGQEEAHVLCCGGGYNKNQLSSHFFLGFGLFVIENSSIVNEAGLGDGCVTVMTARAPAVLKQMISNIPWITQKDPGIPRNTRW